jgi:hypothetical protein
MASVDGYSQPDDPYRRDEASDRCVSLSARFRRAATIVEINGEIDARNADRVSMYVGGFLPPTALSCSTSAVWISLASKVSECWSTSASSASGQVCHGR